MNFIIGGIACGVVLIAVAWHLRKQDQLYRKMVKKARTQLEKDLGRPLTCIEEKTMHAYIKEVVNKARPLENS